MRPRVASLLASLAIAVSLVLAGTATARADSSVVGRSERNRFGRWEWVPFPRMALGIGTSTHVFSLGAITSSPPRRTTTTGGAVPLPGNLLQGNTVVAQTFDLRPLIVHVYGPFYIGPIVQIGPGFRRGTPNQAGYATSSSGLFFEGGLLPGVAFPLGNSDVSVRLEAMLGGRMLVLDGRTTDGSGRSYAAAASSWVAQPRLAIDVWTSPFVTLGAFADTNLVSRGDHVFGLSFAAHLAPFDATP